MNIDRFLTVMQSKVLTAEEEGRYRYYHYNHSRVYALLMAKIRSREVYMKHLEIPLTTYCTLCCRHCANLLQYYSNPTHGSAEQAIGDLRTILSSVDGIALLRLMGGEPLLYPDLYKVLRFCVQEQKIQRTEVLTNGTLLFSEDVMALLSSSVKNGADITICISDYGKTSSKKDLLIRQLDGAGVPYAVLSGKWRDAGNLSRRGWNAGELKNLFRRCVKSVSMLNGELHVCPRSSHGTDLHLVPKKDGEYVVVSKYKNDPAALRDAICGLLSREYINVCNYCDGDGSKDVISNSAKIIPAAEQCSREECLAYAHEVRVQNQTAVGEP